MSVKHTSSNLYAVNLVNLQCLKFGALALFRFLPNLNLPIVVTCDL